MAMRLPLLAAFVLPALLIPAFAQPGPPPPPPPGQPNGPGVSDPGPRPGPAAAGKALAGLSPAEIAFFNEGATRFREVASVKGTQPGAPGVGLGPRFNLNSCAGCHAQPALGGSSPANNPQIAVASSFGAQNAIPAFIQQNGPVRAVRFARNPDNSPDGSVHSLFVITGRADAVGCNIAQPDFAGAVAQNNAFFRIPIPVYGSGLIESIPDSAILANIQANAQAKASLGIAGRVNRSANDNTITRYGWKAQNKSLMVFGGEAYNVEQGVTNEMFPNERDETPGCIFNALPEDQSNPAAATAYSAISDVTGFAAFMRMLAAPDPAPDTASTIRGRQAFASVGCALCHVASMITGQSSSAALNQKSATLYSDLLIHRMAGNLNDNITQGLASGSEWRTAPLWGLGQRLFFLHDGRTPDLQQAIQQHAGPGSESTGVVNAYNALPAASKQDILNFLRAL